MNSLISLASVLLITILILYLSYVFTKSLGKGIGMKKQGGSSMQMLDRLPLGQDKAIAIVRTGNHYFLIGIASSQISLLAELSEEDIQNNPQVPLAGYDNFKNIWMKYTSHHRKDE
ncbi:flagellar biosynthetic protein FliO [Clostridium sp. E02]|uniref:flagellar biosynthetic protein FliO n=1 Tax=Clostridium sp. E02 TaxID=2487134 RepID=UPI000F5384DE|nr:flagellar biosynthetic protein FliO [Clostridium sp. E02]